MLGLRVGGVVGEIVVGVSEGSRLEEGGGRVGGGPVGVDLPLGGRGMDSSEGERVVGGSGWSVWGTEGGGDMGGEELMISNCVGGEKGGGGNGGRVGGE